MHMHTQTHIHMSTCKKGQLMFYSVLKEIFWSGKEDTVYPCELLSCYDRYYYFATPAVTIKYKFLFNSPIFPEVITSSCYVSIKVRFLPYVMWKDVCYQAFV